MIVVKFSYHWGRAQHCRINWKWWKQQLNFLRFSAQFFKCPQEITLYVSIHARIRMQTCVWGTQIKMPGCYNIWDWNSRRKNNRVINLEGRQFLSIDEQKYNTWWGIWISFHSCWKVPTVLGPYFKATV